MKVLLLGDFSGLHENLATGLRKLGVDVTVASNGDGWKNYNRDVDLKQPKRFKRLLFPFKILKSLHRLIGYDVVQIIHPNFLNTSPKFNFLIYKIIKKFNKNIFLGANGHDYYHTKFCSEGGLRFSTLTTPEIKDDPHIIKVLSVLNNKWYKKICTTIANDAVGITACSPSYHATYKHFFPQKTIIIPTPIDTEKYKFVNTITPTTEKVNFFLGIMKNRNKTKGVDRILKVLKKLKNKYPNQVKLTIVDTVPFEEYTKLLNNSHVLCDQLYAYGIGMNGMIAQTKGIIACGGAEPEWYEMVGETENKPIVDINKTDDEMLKVFENMVINKDKLYIHAKKTREFALKHHDSKKVAKQYIDFWNEKIK